jgi:hypothetical protein
MTEQTSGIPYDPQDPVHRILAESFGYTHYFACARNAENRIEQVLVTREHGRQVSQVWTGRLYATEREAAQDLERLNCGS